jgi:hypothetical protein
MLYCGDCGLIVSSRLFSQNRAAEPCGVARACCGRPCAAALCHVSSSDRAQRHPQAHDQRGHDRAQEGEAGDCAAGEALLGVAGRVAVGVQHAAHRPDKAQDGGGDGVAEALHGGWGGVGLS